MRVRVRLFAIQRELAGTREVALELPDGATVADAWNGLVELHPALAPGRASVRFARNGSYADETTPLSDSDEVAMIPPVSGGAASAQHILEIRSEPFGDAILVELAERLATPEDGAVVGFLGRTRDSPGTPAPGQEGRPTVAPWRLAIGLATRYALLLGAGYVIIARLHLHPLGVLVGVSAVVVAAMMEAVRSWRQPTGFSP